MWDISRAKRGQQKHSTRLCMFMSNKLPSGHFYCSLLWDFTEEKGWSLSAYLH